MSCRSLSSSRADALALATRCDSRTSSSVTPASGAPAFASTSIAMRSPSITGDQYSPKRAVACAIVVAVTASIAPVAEPAANRTVRPGVACARRTATRMLAALAEATSTRATRSPPSSVVHASFQRSIRWSPAATSRPKPMNWGRPGAA